MINCFRFGVKKKESLYAKAPEGWPLGQPSPITTAICVICQSVLII